MAVDDKCVILIKAQPHRGSNYFETVCCAGIGLDGKWRRQYPVPFRILDETQKFRRWSWISYKFNKPNNDPRTESQKVDPNSIVQLDAIPKQERSRFVAPLIRNSFGEADEKNESLTLIRVSRLAWSWKRKSASEITKEKDAHASLADQLQLIDASAKPLEPCPFSFHVKWAEENGKPHEHESDDWETVGAFARFSRDYGEGEALRILKQKYEVDYVKSGLALAFSTHKRRNKHFGTKNQWLLVGLIRVDDNKQTELSF